MPKPPIELYIGDVVQTRKPHPCGGSTWRVVRLGAEIGMRCEQCGRRVLLPPHGEREIEVRYRPIGTKKTPVWEVRACSMRR